VGSNFAVRRQVDVPHVPAARVDPRQRQIVRPRLDIAPLQVSAAIA
jgi:hypothetical protein